MAITNSVVNNGAATAIYTSSGNSTCTVVYFCNTGASNRVLEVWAYASAGSATDATKIYKALPLVAGETYVMDTEKIIFANGDVLAAKVDAGADVTATVSSVAI
jgi:hypothetical protein